MTNLEKLIEAGIVPLDHTLSDDDSLVIENLSHLELACLVDLKHKLGDEFLQRNIRDAANCFL
jgi:hypothetical protein